jgi:glutamate racemase
MTELGEVRDVGRVSTERIVSKVSEAAPEKKMEPTAPIGMFDSGVGGLSVLSQVMKELPNEDVLYFADTARVPYGGRSKQEIININKELIGYLMNEGVKMIIMACGTSSSMAYPLLKDEYKIPIVGIVGPGSRQAVRSSGSGRIGLLATVGTVESAAFQNEIKAIKPTAEVTAMGCPLFVPLIEGGFVDTEETKRVAEEYLKPLMEKKVDTIILGCTHYPHLRSVIQEIVGPEVELVDPSAESVLEAKALLKKKGLLSSRSGPASYTYLVSGSVPQFKDLASRLSGKPVVSLRRVNLVAKKGPIE